MVYKESKSSVEKKKDVYVNMKGMELETYSIAKSQ